NVTGVLSHSSNVGVSKLVLESPPEQLTDVYLRSGFGHRTDSGYPGENEGVISKVENRFVLATLSFGYGLSVTAIQIARAYLIFANHGRLIPISLIKQDEVADDTQVVKPQTADKILTMLEETVENGTGIFAKVPGLSVWENDASGMQVNVATRGLSPNRSWDFNVRQNSYDISSEVFGYPEAYFQPPAEAIDRIEIIRGASSLSYGPQLGGLLNYRVKQAPTNKTVEVESYQTKASFGVFNSYTSLGGTIKRMSYFGYFHYRQGDGWRENNLFNSYTGFLQLKYQLAKNWTLGAEYTRMNYVSQQPGGLSDSAFFSNPRASFRSRNWFNVPWNIAALTLHGKVKETWFIDMTVFGLLGQRNSVGFIKSINIPDTISLSDGQYAPRQVDRDYYRNLGIELRILKTYRLLNKKHSLSTGFRAYSGNIQRNQLGIGTRNTDFDLSIEALTDGKEFGRSFDLTTQNYALFVENLFKIGKRLGLSPGIRFEHIRSGLNGYNAAFVATNGQVKEQSIARSILLFG
ncbi:MAG: hypothetical protein EBX50_20150, partial [Chitinophagia bacterium]|nr:hypothetical protein [Chitinophagia bacterium]